MRCGIPTDYLLYKDHPCHWIPPFQSVYGGLSQQVSQIYYLPQAVYQWDWSSTIVGSDEPDVVVAPIITDGTHIRSLHWTGHYIPDPTLAFAQGA